MRDTLVGVLADDIHILGREEGKETELRRTQSLHWRETGWDRGAYGLYNNICLDGFIFGLLFVEISKEVQKVVYYVLLLWVFLITHCATVRVSQEFSDLLKTQVSL